MTKTRNRDLKELKTQRAMQTDTLSKKLGR